MSSVEGFLFRSVPISRKKNKCSHRERRARAKARVRRWRRRALPVALVVRCRRRSGNIPPRLASISTEPVRWKWKEKKVGLSSVMSGLEPSTLRSFCAVDHDFLRLPHLLKTLCNHDYHVRQIKSALDRVALLRGIFEMQQSDQSPLDPKTLILIWDTGASAGLTPFFVVILSTMLSVRLTSGTSPKSIKLSVLGQLCISSWISRVMMFICHVLLTIFQLQMSVCFHPRYTISFMVVIL